MRGTFSPIILCVLLSTSTPLYAEVSQFTEVLDTISLEETSALPSTTKAINSTKAIESELKQLPNTNVIGELSGQPVDLVINGVNGFRHNYSIMGIPINFASTSSSDLSLLGNGRYESVDIAYKNRFVSSAIGSNVNFTPKIEGDNFLLLKGSSNKNFSSLVSYLFPKKFEYFDTRLTADANIYKNSYDYAYNNGTLYNDNDDTTLSYDIGWSNNFHVTLSEKFYDNVFIQDMNLVNRSIPMKNSKTEDPTEKIFSLFLAGKINKVFLDSYIYNQNFLWNVCNSEVIDTNKTILYNMGYASHIVGKKTKLSAPFSVEKFFENANLSINILPSYDISMSDDLLSKKILNNSKRVMLNESISYTHTISNFEILSSISQSNSFDRSEGIYRVFNFNKENYQNDYSVYDYFFQAGYHFGFAKLSTYYSTANRFPSLYELYGDNLFVLPNPSLKSEKSTIKTGSDIHFNFNRLKFGATFCYNSIDNLITANVMQNRTVKYVNTNSADIYSTGLDAAYGLDNVFNLSFNIAYNYAVNQSKGNLYGFLIPNIHPVTSKLITNFYINKYLNFNVNSFFYSKVFTNNTNTEYKMPKVENIDIDGSYGYLPNQMKIDVGLSMLNNYFKTILEVENALDNRVSLSTKQINQGRIFSITLIKNIERNK